MTQTTTSTAPPTHHGEVFTRRWVVDALLDLTGYTPDLDLATLVLVEPAAGSGAFLLPAIERLVDSAARHGRAAEELTNAVRAWELRPYRAAELRRSVAELLICRGTDEGLAHRLARHWVTTGDFLLAPGRVRADVVVGNPPYIRLEDLSGTLSVRYRSLWKTMGGRADIYVGFIERSLAILKPGGRVGLICPDRWMRNQYGDRLRRLVAGRFAVDHVWVMHDADAFESRVSAYPAITVLRNGQQGAVIAADTTVKFGERSARQLLEWSHGAATDTVSGEGFTANRLPHWFPGEESWPSGTPSRLRLIETLGDRFVPLHDPDSGTRVSIGVATGADGVFITTDAEAAEPDRMLPLSMVSDLTSGTFRWSGHYLVNPWDSTGSLVDLADYPRLARYLAASGPRLRARHVARKAPRNWYRTIDKVNHQLTARPKLLLQDMRTTIHPVLDPGGYYPHHNLYYVVSETWDIEVLGGILLSRIAQAFVEAYCVRMRGGTLRFQAQYLKRIRIPRPYGISPRTQNMLRTAFRERDAELATHAAADAFGINTKDYGLG